MERESISIRSASPDDAQQMHLLHTHSSVFPHLLQLPYSTVDTWKERLKPQENNHILIACSNDEIVGAIGCRLNPNPRIRHKGYLGMAVKHTHQGQGVGSRLMAEITALSDQWLNLKRL